MAEVSLEGMDQLVNRIQQLGQRAGRVENDALKAGAKVMQSAIKARAPRSASPRQPTGRTQKWRTGEHGADHIAISRIKSSAGVKSVLVGLEKADNSPYFYLKFHEWGTSKMSAQPFMGPAANAARSETIDAMKNVIKGALGL